MTDTKTLIAGGALAVTLFTSIATAGMSWQRATNAVEAVEKRVDRIEAKATEAERDAKQVSREAARDREQLLETLAELRADVRYLRAAVDHSVIGQAIPQQPPR